jgi:hypothetical protein
MAKVAYIPNDPLASGGPEMRRISPKPFPSGATARFDVQPPARAGEYPPHTAEFDYWQARTALIDGLRLWQQIDGAYLPRWWGNQATLPVLTNAGDDLNAFYDRASLQFFAHTFDGVTVHSAESADVVVHEQGHAFLDAIRPDFFDVPFIEVGALHEAFGDCVALLASLEDGISRERALAASADLGAPQFLESLAEQLGDAILREFGPGSVEDGGLRHALNTFRWSDPTTLPPSAPADQLSGEVHSFSRVFTGAVYDSLRNVFATGPSTSAGLRKASRTIGKLLISAIRAVPATPRVFDGVGRRMLQADVGANRGRNVEAIRDGFLAHGLDLGAPSTSLEVPVTGTARDATRRLRGRLQAPASARLEVTPVDTESHGPIAHVAAFRPVSLTGEPGLEGVRVMVPGVARVRRSGRSITGVLGEVTPASTEAEREARALARVLLANGDIAAAPTRRTRGRRADIVAAPQRPSPFPPTHEIRRIGGENTLVRRGFAARRSLSR